MSYALWGCMYRLVLIVTLQEITRQSLLRDAGVLSRSTRIYELLLLGTNQDVNVANDIAKFDIRIRGDRGSH